MSGIGLSFVTLFHRDLPEYVFLMGNKGLLGIVIGAALWKTGDFIGDFLVFYCNRAYCIHAV